MPSIFSPWWFAAITVGPFLGLWVITSYLTSKVRSNTFVLHLSINCLVLLVVTAYIFLSPDLYPPTVFHVRLFYAGLTALWGYCAGFILTSGKLQKQKALS